MSNVNWSPYQAPTQTLNERLHWQPSGTTILGGTTNPLAYYADTSHGPVTPDMLTNRAVKLDGAYTRDQMGQMGQYLSGQMGQGFSGMEDLFNQYGSLGGLGGIQNSGNASAVYRPNGNVFGAGGTQTANNQGNGQQLPFGQSNPFNATF